MKVTVTFLLVGSAVFCSGTAVAQTCPFDRDVTVSGTIQEVDPRGAQKIFMTDVSPVRGCDIWLFGVEGALPAACQKGRRFTATGRVQHSLVLPDGVYSLLATRLACQ